MLSRLTEFIAHFHPVLVHLPIGILLIALLFHYLSTKEKYLVLAPAIPIAYLAGTITAVASCVTGWLLSGSGEYDETTLSLHQWAGILVAFTAGTGYLYSVQQNMRQLRYISIAILLLVTVTGHLGGTLTHGEGYLTKAFGAATKDSVSVRKAILNAQEAVVYEEIIRPVLQEKCYGCHAATKQKGGLRLDSREWIMKGGKNGAVILAGSPDSSAMYHRIILDPVEEKHMPPKGKPQLTEQERLLLQWWIAGGADFAKKSKELVQTAAIKTALTSLEKAPEATVPHASIPDHPVSAASDKTIKALQQKGVTVYPVALNSNYLTANFVNLPVWDQETASLVNDLKEQLLWIKLPGAKLDPAAWKMIAGCKNLMRLAADHSNISDADLAAFGSLDHLAYLNLVGTKITSKGLMQLQHKNNITAIYLSGTAVKTADIMALRQSFPKASIDTGGYQLEKLVTDTQTVKFIPKK